MDSPKSTALLSQFSPLSLAKAAWKGKTIVVLFCALASGIATIIAHRLPAIYHAETLILVDSQKIPERYVAATVSSDIQDRLATISQQILSATRLKTMMEEFNLYPDERKKLAPEEVIELMRKDVEIRIEKGWGGGRPGAFRIAYEGPSPTLVAEVANRLSSIYIEENLRVRELQADGTTEFIEAQLKEAKKNLDDMEAAVSRYKVQHNGDLPQQEGALSGALSRLQVELQGNQDGSNRAQQTKVVLESSLQVAQGELSALTRPVARDPEGEGATAPVAVTAVRPAAPPPKRSEVLEAQLEGLRARYSDNHPDIKRLRVDIAMMKALEAKDTAQTPVPVPPPPPDAQQPKSKQPGVVAAKPTLLVSPEMAREIERIQERVEELKTQIRLLTKQLDNYTAERQSILKQISDYQGRLTQMPIREQETAALTRDYDISKQNYRSLLDKKISAEMASDMERRQKSERFTVLDPAQPPQKPFKPNRKAIVGMGSVLGFALGMVVAIGKQMIHGALLGEWELPKHVPVLGRIPEIDSSDELKKAKNSRPNLKSRKLRLAVVSSALLLLLGVVAAGTYFWWKRF
jgi:succinoglycan biosynthesis transport protein ExoP